MTWAFLERYCDEAYAMVDARDTAMKKAVGLRGALDVELLRERLRAL
jgi:hypothetical protein